MNNEPPKIAQFTAISGKKIPNELYNEGANFSTIISTNCTIVATEAMNKMKVKKLKSNSANDGSNQANAPAPKT